MRVEHLLELALYGDRQVRFPEVKRFADQRKAGVGDHRLAPNQVLEKSIEARFLEDKIAVFSFPLKSITDKPAADTPQMPRQLWRRRRHVNHDVLPGDGFG